jgi:hypothetical protein
LIEILYLMDNLNVEIIVNSVNLDGHVFVENAGQLVNVDGIVLFVNLLQSLNNKDNLNKLRFC